MKNSYFKIIGLVFALVMIITLANAQDYPTSVGPAPIQNMKITTDPSPYLAVGTRAFTQISSSPTFQFGKSFMESCAITNIGAPFTITSIPGGLVYRNGVVYTWSQSSPYQLWSIDTVTGIPTPVFNMTGVPLANFTGMCWNGTTMYGVSTNLLASQIFTVNMTTGVCTPIGTASTACSGAVLIMGRIGAQYSLYSVDIVLDNLYRWNKATGAATLVGSLGVDAANVGQDGCVDPNDNTFYWMAYTTGPELRKFDTLTVGSTVLCTYTAQGTGIALVPSPVGIQPISNEIPQKYSLEQNYPNPFNPTTKIRFALPKSSFAKIVVYDATGRELETLVNEQLNAGIYEADWNADKFSSGVYYYRLVAGDNSETKKMILVR